MSYGDLNSLYYEVVAIKDGGTSYTQPISSLNTIQMYKTNSQYSYEPDDFANLFSAIKDIKEAML